MSGDASETTTAVTVVIDDEPPAMNTAAKSRIAIRSLSAILPFSVPPSLDDSPDPAITLLRDPDTYAAVSARLRRADSGAGDDNICRWLYDAFHSGDPGLRLVVLRHVPLLAGAYLSRAAIRRPLPGFEAVLLSLYADETASRAGHPVTVMVPDVSHSSLYHESAAASAAENTSTALNLSVVSPALEPCSAVRSTRRGKIVGVALELYYGKVQEMPKESKLDFCHVCRDWAGRWDDSGGGESKGERGRCTPLPWEVMQPIMRILGHCIVGNWANEKEVCEAAKEACGSLHVRAIHDINAKAILAIESLLRLANMSLEPIPTQKKVHDDINDDNNDNDDDGDDQVGVSTPNEVHHDDYDYDQVD